MFYAHSIADGNGQPHRFDEWELLEAHAEAVARQCAGFCSSWQAAELGRLLGLWHDIGKYQAAFQKRLSGSTEHVPHAGAGALLAAQRAGEAGPLLAFVIAGHHTGLTDRASSNAGRTPLKEVLVSNQGVLVEVLKNAPQSVVNQPQPQLPAWLKRCVAPQSANDGKRTLSFFTRMLFSALVDADRLATSEFYASVERRVALHHRLQYASLPELRDRLDAFIDRRAESLRGGPLSAMNQLRADVLHACRKASSRRSGFFSLTVPTGGGKTLSAMSFALRHAVVNEQQRVIVVIPYTSIITQNAERYKDAFSPDGVTPDDQNVLEHHSAIDRQKRSEHNFEQELRRATAAENWDAPIIVTTSVQFFESLYSDHPSRCRKLHRIAKSVIILDEVQTLPAELLRPILDALRELVAHYGCTIVLSTATPPALRKRPGFDEGLEDIEPIIPDVSALFSSPAARRVAVEWRVSERTSYEQLAAEMAAEKQVLAIVHRRPDARALAERVPERGRFHLSALMCPAHRIARIAEINDALSNNKTCRVVSTQLIEAGVDVDFPVVYRALAGIDSLAQSAGRCDREGKLTAAAGAPAGRFVVFRAESDPPGELLRKAAEITQTMLGMADEEPSLAGGIDLLNPDHAELFFRMLYDRSHLDARQIRLNTEQFNFATVGRSFQMIEEAGMRSIVVPWGEGQSRIDAYLAKPTLQTQRGLQPFIVQVNRRYFETLADRGIVEEVNDAFGIPTSLFSSQWYSDEFGLLADPGASLEPEVLVI
jgi:CRISPR-associated endonuclease/helicase Cas3